ncbi:OsmC family protein [Bacillus massilinigeriensis]|uniref:OsmC family protein n=1 Tax=Bacillus mediterraneensis TaxID=1805474 RepID=UPI0008F89860|nr:OsmC family protein [Bacillus mediterraneensis]
MKFEMKEEEGFYAELEHGRLDVSGNPEHGYRPLELLVSSAAVCSGSVLRTVMEKMRIPFKKISVTGEAVRSDGAGSLIEGIDLHFVIEGKDLQRKKVEKALTIAARNCPIVQSLHGGIPVGKTFEIVEDLHL